MSSLMKGTAILTIGMFLSKILGLVYIFPFYAIIGQQNVALYSYAYVPYTIMLSIAISGAPIAVSKFVAKYNSLGDYESGRKLVKSGLLIMTITGFLSFLALYLLANPIAHIVIKDDEQVFNVSQIAGVIRWVSFALIVVPFMSLVRGFFQGYDYMEPTATSQLVEQIIRIIALLTGSYLVMRVFSGKAESAISFAVFSAFIGAIAGLISLWYYWRKLKPEFDLKLHGSVSSGQLSYKNIYKEVITYSIPYVFVGIANPLFQLVDMLTFNTAMSNIGLAKVSDDYLGMLNFTTHKIVIIPVMLATGFSMALVPAITNYYTKKQHDALITTMDKTYQILLFITLPAVVGISVLSTDIYHLLYSESTMGASVLATYAPVAILFAFFQVTAALLQGIDFQKWIVFSLLTGILVKLAINIPLIEALQTKGAILATSIGYIASIVINIMVLKKALHYRSKMVIRRSILIVVLTLIMAAFVIVVHHVLVMIFGAAHSKLLALVYLIICISIGAVVYAFLSFRIGLAQKLLGAKIAKFASKLGFRG